MLTTETLDFVRDLAKNNNRDWFLANKKRYEAHAKGPFHAFIAALAARLAQNDPALETDPKRCVFRINRDIRFSQDKSPYKPQLSAGISRRGRMVEDDPGYYIHLESGMLMLAGGAYGVSKEGVQRVREHIAREPQRFRAILDAPDFVEHYGGLKGERNKRLPLEFRDLAAQVPEIANKQFYFSAELPPQQALGPDAVAFIAHFLEISRPLQDFLREALD